MILKEFDLDLPEADKNTRHEFRNDVRCVAAHYFSFFPKKFKANGFWKVLVECVTNDGEPQIFMGVNVVKVSFNFEKYRIISKKEKKSAILNALHNGLLKVSSKEGWDVNWLNTCRDKVISEEFDYYWLLKKPKKNRERKLIAYIFCHHDMDKFSASIRVENLDGSIVYENILVNTDPNEFVFAYELGDFKWVSNDEIEYFNKSKIHVATIKVSENKTHFIN